MVLNCIAIAQIVLYRAEALGMTLAERRNLDVLEIKCLRRIVGVTFQDRLIVAC